MSLFTNVVNNIENRKRRMESGKWNSIPCPFPKLSQYYGGIEKGKYEMVTANKKAGKCFGAGTQILMFDGSIKTVETIVENELLMGPDSKPRIASGITTGKEKMFNIKRKGFEDIRVNESHILYLYHIKKKEYLTLTVKEYNELLPTVKTYYKWVQSEAINFHKEDNIQIEPYFYGLWLGDGNKDDIGITNIDPEIIDYIYEFAEVNDLNVSTRDITYYLSTAPILIEHNDDEIKWSSVKQASKHYNIQEEYISRATKTNKTINNSKWQWKAHRGDFKKLFKEDCGFNKFNISKKYLLSSIENRRELLAGIIDSDGYLDKKERYEIIQKNKSLIDDIVFLVRSLGIKCKIGKIKIINNKQYYRISLSGENLNQIRCKIKRKKFNNTMFKYNRLHTSFVIEEDIEDTYYGFTVNSDNLFLLSDFSIVHNTQFTDFMYVYHPVRFCEHSKSDLDIRVKYLSLEMTKEQKMIQAMCHFLYYDSEGRIRVSPADLRSTSKPLDPEILETLRKYEPFFIKFLDRVEYRDDLRNIDEIIAYVKRVCDESDKYGEQITEIILDHISLVIPRRNQTKKQAIDEISASLFVGARNNFRINPIVVQQQANEKESFEAKKMNDLLPSFGGLSDSKDTARDIDLAFGVFSPEAAKMNMYGSLQVAKHGDGLRIINIVGGRESAGQKELAVKFDGAVSFFQEL